VLPIQERRGDGGDEELRAVAVWAGVGHGQQARLRVLDGEVLVRERLGAVDARRARAVAVQEVTALAHEVFDLSDLLSIFPSYFLVEGRGETGWGEELETYDPVEFTPLVPLRSS